MSPQASHHRPMLHFQLQLLCFPLKQPCINPLCWPLQELPSHPHTALPQPLLTIPLSHSCIWTWTWTTLPITPGISSHLHLFSFFIHACMINSKKKSYLAKYLASLGADLPVFFHMCRSFAIFMFQLNLFMPRRSVFLNVYSDSCVLSPIVLQCPRPQWVILQLLR